jgi:hypothetical protein
MEKALSSLGVLRAKSSKDLSERPAKYVCMRMRREVRVLMV